jgi:hypothetical protein
MFQKGPASPWEKKIGPFLIKEKPRRYREAGKGYSVSFAWGLDTNKYLKSRLELKSFSDAS